MHVILLSADPVALDATVCRMVEPIMYGNSFELGSSRNITYQGEPVSRFATPDFQVNRSPASTEPDLLSYSFMRNYVAPRPFLHAERCNYCGRCEQVCPSRPKALTWSSGKKNPPVYNYSLCIRCYCCQELCPQEAITVKVPLLGRLVRRGR